MPTATCLDHLGVYAEDAQALHGAYERLGFTLTPLSRQSGRLAADGPLVPFGTANRCAMLAEGYLELLAVMDPAAPLNGADRFLARYAGAHIVALGMEDEGGNLRRLRAGGLDVAGVLPLERRVDASDPASPLARFARLPLPDAPEGRIQLVRHLTPELLWRPEWTTHANRAEALDGAIIAVEHPAESAARFSRLAGVPVTPDRAGGFRLDLPRGWVRLLPASALAAVLPAVDAPALPPALPWVAAAVIRTSDGADAARALAAGLPHREAPDGLLILPQAAGGLALVFH